MDWETDELGWKLLFKAVLMRAARDAFLSNVSQKDKQNALEFLTGGRDLDLACDIAGVDVEDIKYYMKNLSPNNNTNYKRILRVVKK